MTINSTQLLPTGGVRYNKDAATLAWSRTMDFFKKTLVTTTM